MAKRIENGESKPTHEEIARRARSIYEESGCLPGRDLDNWLQAETELQGRHKMTPAPRFETREQTPPARTAAPGKLLREATSRTGS